VCPCISIRFEATSTRWLTSPGDYLWQRIHIDNHTDNVRDLGSRQEGGDLVALTRAVAPTGNTGVDNTLGKIALSLLAPLASLEHCGLRPRGKSSACWGHVTEQYTGVSGNRRARVPLELDDEENS
jgi:hypothetical protein